MPSFQNVGESSPNWLLPRQALLSRRRLPAPSHVQSWVLHALPAPPEPRGKGLSPRSVPGLAWGSSFSGVSSHIAQHCRHSWRSRPGGGGLYFGLTLVPGCHSSGDAALLRGGVSLTPLGGVFCAPHPQSLGTSSLVWAWWAKPQKEGLPPSLSPIPT